MSFFFRLIKNAETWESYAIKRLNLNLSHSFPFSKSLHRHVISSLQFTVAQKANVKHIKKWKTKEFSFGQYRY